LNNLEELLVTLFHLFAVFYAAVSASNTFRQKCPAVCIIFLGKPAHQLHARADTQHGCCNPMINLSMFLSQVFQRASFPLGK
jgi:hypothetical protein